MVEFVSLLAVWGLLVLYGLVYLIVDSDLLASVRDWFVRSVTEAGTESGTDKTSTESGTDIETPPAAPELLADVEVLADGKVSGRKSKPRVLKRVGRALRRFIGRVVSCWFCTAGWAANLSAGLMVGFYFARLYEVWWLVVTIAVVATSLAGIGFVTIVDHFSPKRASDRIVDVLISVSEAALPVLTAVLKPPPVLKPPASPKEK